MFLTQIACSVSLDVQNGVERSSRIEWLDQKSEVLVKKTTTTATTTTKMQATKTGGGPLLKESPFSNVVLAILGEKFTTTVWRGR